MLFSVYILAKILKMRIPGLPSWRNVQTVFIRVSLLFQEDSGSSWAAAIREDPLGEAELGWDCKRGRKSQLRCYIYTVYVWKTPRN